MGEMPGTAFERGSDLNASEMIMRHVHRIREGVTRAIASPTADVSLLRAALADLERLSAELESVSLVAAPAGVLRYATPDGLWLKVPDGGCVLSH